MHAYNIIAYYFWIMSVLEVHWPLVQRMKMNLDIWVLRLKRFVAFDKGALEMFNEFKLPALYKTWFIHIYTCIVFWSLFFCLLPFIKLWLKLGASRQDLDLWTENLRKVFTVYKYNLYCITFFYLVRVSL